MRNDTQTYLRCADCGEFVNSSEEAAHECPPEEKKAVGKRGCCLKCGSVELRYVQEATEYHAFELDQFPSEDGYLDLVGLDETYPHDTAKIVCLDCDAQFTLKGEEIKE